jgi:ATP-dependent DNA helicase RecQ
MNYSSKDIHAALKQHFGYDAFRAGQYDIVHAILCGRDVLAIMGTGHGKSVCFQLPALIAHRTSLVVSPLLALAKDQVADLAAHGIRAAQYNSTISPAAKSDLCRQLMADDDIVHLLYVTPESFVHGEFADLLGRMVAAGKVGAFIVDEVHTMEEWGNDFRPDFLRLGVLRDRYPAVPIAAFTATADRAARLAICDTLHIRHAARLDVLLPFNRPNITPFFVQSKTPLVDMQHRVESYEAANQSLPCCIAYCSTRKEAEKAAAAFGKMMPAMAPAVYHAGMAEADKERAYLAWKGEASGPAQSATCRIVFATTAFGMGINKADVRFVFQLTPPRNVEALMQMMGRGGRDGRQAHYILYVNFGAIHVYERFIDGDVKTAKITAARAVELRAKLNGLRRVMRCTAPVQCRRALIVGQIDGNEAATLKCGGGFDKCDVCAGVTPAATPVKPAIAKKRPSKKTSWVKK